MSGINGQYGQPPPAVNAWQEIRSADGRVYYYNAATKVTQWTKPDDLMTTVERALQNQPWKEYTAEGGRKYWHNTETKQSSWEMPEAYKKALGVASTPAAPLTPVAIPTGPAAYHANNSAGYDHPRDFRDGPLPESRQLGYGGSGNEQTQRTALVPSGYEQEQSTANASAEEAEAAFVKVLRRNGVQPDWTWIQTLEAIAKDPHSRSIRDPRERKAAFERYCQDVVAQDKERARERLNKLRAGFATMLRSHPEIKHYTHWRTARPILEGETIFRSTNDENERRRLFDDYVADLRRAHREQRAIARKNAMDSLIELLPQLHLDPYTRWADALPVIEATPLFQKQFRKLRAEGANNNGNENGDDEDDMYPPISKFDVLTAFQNHIKALERAQNDAKQQEKTAKLRAERKNREAFVALLADLRKADKIKAGTKWTQIYPLIEHDDRYLNMVGQAGSTPQDLFWDLVEEEQGALRATRNNVEDVVQDKRFDIAPNTTFDSFLGLMRDDRRTANIDRDVLGLIFEQLKTKKKEQRSDEDRMAERYQRRALDDFRAFLKHVQPPLTASDTYEKVKPRLLKAEEYQAVNSEEARQSAVEKYIRRLRDREEDAERERQRRRERASAGDDKGLSSSSYRERDRGERLPRSGPSSRLGRSRSPEADNYEADRRRAIAERERNHRPSFGESADDRRSVDPRDRERDRERERDRIRDRDSRDRDRDSRDSRDRFRERERERERDRYRDEDRPPRSRRDESHYDRERRDREEEREKQYRRRVADRIPEELNYGDEKPPSVRRRREDEDGGRRESRDSKRVKRESSRERTPQHEPRRSKEPPASSTVPASGPVSGAASTSTPTGASASTVPGKEDPGGVHSGSEEGEIEED